MQGLGITLGIVALMMALNVLMVTLTLGIKVLRVLGARRTKSRLRRLEAALDDSLATGEVHPYLRRLGDRDMDLLAILMVEYLAVLRGTERGRLVGVAEEAGLVEGYFSRLRARPVAESPGRGEPRLFRRPGRHWPAGAALVSPGRNAPGGRRKIPGPHRNARGRRGPGKDAERPLRTDPLEDGGEPGAHRVPGGRAPLGGLGERGPRGAGICSPDPRHGPRPTKSWGGGF